MCLRRLPLTFARVVIFSLLEIGSVAKSIARGVGYSQGCRLPLCLPFVPAAMGFQWQVQDLIQEVGSMTALLDKRGSECPNIAAALSKQLTSKMFAAKLTISQVLDLSNCIEKAELPAFQKNELLAACDKLAISHGHDSSAVALRLQPQACD